MKNVLKVLGTIAMAGDGGGGGGAFASFSGCWKNPANEVDFIIIDADGSWTRKGTYSFATEGILHHNSESGSTDIHDTTGTEVGNAKITSGKLEWYIHMDVDYPAIFTKG